MLLALCISAGLGTSSAAAQNQTHRFGVGGMVGRTAGITAKLFLPTDSTSALNQEIRTLDVSLTWTADDLALWSIHVLTHRNISSSPLQLYIGPGVALSLKDTQLSWGISSSLGLFFVKRRFDVFLQITPRLMILPDFDGAFGSAVGLRYYL